MTDRIFPEYRRGSHRPLPVGWPSTVAALSAALEPVPDEMELAWLCTLRRGIPEELVAGRFGVGLRMTKGWFCPEIPECAGRLRKEMPFHFSGFCLRKQGKHCHRALVLLTNWRTDRFSQPLQTVGELKACLSKAPKSAPVFAPDWNHVSGAAAQEAFFWPEYDPDPIISPKISCCEPLDDRVNLFFGQDVQGKEYLFLRTSFLRDNGWN